MTLGYIYIVLLLVASQCKYLHGQRVYGKPLFKVNVNEPMFVLFFVRGYHTLLSIDK